jgi:hypothetical protein
MADFPDEEEIEELIEDGDSYSIEDKIFNMTSSQMSSQC